LVLAQAGCPGGSAETLEVNIGGKMKTIYAALILFVLIVGCEKSVGNRAANPQDYNNRAQEYDEQLKRTGEQITKYDHQVKKMEEQSARYDKLLERWEKQADRYEAFLNKLEKQTSKSK